MRPMSMSPGWSRTPIGARLRDRGPHDEPLAGTILLAWIHHLRGEPPWLHSDEVYTLQSVTASRQAGQRVAHRDELVGDVPLEPDVGDGAGDPPVVQLLRVVELVPPGVAAGVVVAVVLAVGLDRPDHVPFHDLHVVDVVEQLEVARADPLDQLDAPGRVVAHVVLVVDLAVEQLHLEDHAGLLRRGDDLPEGLDAVLHPGLAVDAAAVAREADDVLPALLGRGLDRRVDRLQRGVVELGVAEAVGQRMRAGHRADQAVLLERREVGGREQVDADQAHPLRRGAEVVQRDLAVAPAADRLLEPSLGRGLARLLAGRGRGQAPRGAGGRQRGGRSQDRSAGRTRFGSSGRVVIVVSLPGGVKSRTRRDRSPDRRRAIVAPGRGPGQGTPDDPALLRDRPGLPGTTAIMSSVTVRPTSPTPGTVAFEAAGGRAGS